MREKDPREITPLIDKSFSFFGAGKWKLKGEQGCSEPIVAGLSVIGSDRGPAPRGLIWEFTGASRISLRHISLMSLSTAWIRRFTRFRAVSAVSWSKLQQVSRGHICTFLLCWCADGTLCFDTRAVITRTVKCAKFISHVSCYDYIYIKEITRMLVLCMEEVQRPRCFWINILLSYHCRYNWGERTPGYLRILFLK